MSIKEKLDDMESYFSGTSVLKSSQLSLQLIDACREMHEALEFYALEIHGCGNMPYHHNSEAGKALTKVEAILWIK